MDVNKLSRREFVSTVAGGFVGLTGYGLPQATVEELNSPARGRGERFLTRHFPRIAASASVGALLGRRLAKNQLGCADLIRHNQQTKREIAKRVLKSGAWMGEPEKEKLLDQVMALYHRSGGDFRKGISAYVEDPRAKLFAINTHKKLSDETLLAMAEFLYKTGKVKTDFLVSNYNILNAAASKSSLLPFLKKCELMIEEMDKSNAVGLLDSAVRNSQSGTVDFLLSVDGFIGKVRRSKDQMLRNLESVLQGLKSESSYLGMLRLLGQNRKCEENLNMIKETLLAL